MNAVSCSPVNLLRVAHSFPAAPRIMARLGPLLRDPGAALGEIAGHLKRDSALAARLLRIANSAAFAQGEPVAAIEDAAALVGLRDIHRLVGAVAVDHFSSRHYPLHGFSGPRLRDNALLAALLMEELAGPAEQDPAAAYSAGLFRSLGRLALARIADEHAPVAPFEPAGLTPLHLWEKDTFGLTGNQAAAAILREWKFPPAVVQAVEGHYDPAVPEHPLAMLLNLAAGLADQLGFGLPGEARYWREPAQAAEAAGFGAQHLGGVTARAVAAFDRINRALG